MADISDQELLEKFTREHSDEAFTLIVERYIALVHASAKRQVRDAHTADDVTQAVFMVLARKAAGLKTPLAGWLLKTTHYCAIDAGKLQRRRAFHERKAAAMRQESQSPPAQDDLPAFLDQCLAALGETDRNVLALHYLHQQPVDEVARAIAMSESAVRKRLERALRKLQARLTASAGHAVNLATLPALLVGAVPHGGTGLAAHAIAHAALHGGAQAALVPAAISQGALHMMKIAKLKIAAGLAIALLAAALTSYGVLRPAFAQNAAAPAAPAAALTPVPSSAPVTTAENPLGLEIVAVGPYQSGDHPWWSTSGEKMDFQRPAQFKGEQYPARPREKWYEFAIRRGADATPEMTWINLSRGAAQVIVNNSAPGWSFVVISAPETATTGGLRVLGATGRWKTVLTFPIGGGHLTGMQTLPGDHTIAFEGPMQDGQNLEFVLIEDITTGTYVPRHFVAIAKDGNETITAGRATMGDKFSMLTATFNNLKVADVQTIRCDVRPMDAWMRFDNISFDGQPSKPGVYSGTISIPVELEALLKQGPKSTVPTPAAPPKSDLP